MRYARFRSVLFALGCLAAAPSAHAATFTCLSGDVQCLIQAIRAANLSNDPTNTITLAPGVYSLTATDTVTADGPFGLPDVTRSITVDVSGTGMATIERATTAPAIGLFHVAAPGHLTLRHLIVTRGANAIYVRGSVVLENSAVTSSSAGVFNAGGTATIAGSTFTSDNPAILQTGGVTTVARTAFSGNRAALGCPVINSSGGDVRVSDSVVADGGTGIVNGGICVNSGTASITRSSFLRNFADGTGALTVRAPAAVIVSKSTFSQNGAPVISNQGGSLTVRDSTFANNVHSNINGTPAIVLTATDTGTTSLVNDTFAGNTVTAPGQTAPLPLVRGAGTTMVNSIIVHLPGDRLVGCSQFTSLGHNILTADDACSLPLRQSDMVGNGGVAAFVDNGSPGNGHFNLLPISPAINVGDTLVCGVTDQLGKYRTRACDIGAIEFKPTYKATTNEEFEPTDEATTNDDLEASMSPSSR